jgi:predicted permease
VAWSGATAGLLGLAGNLSGIHLPPLANNVLETLGAANTPLAMLTLGAFIQFKNVNWKPIELAVGLRMGLGFLLGQALVGLVGLSGIERAVVGIGAAMPIGLVVLVYAASEGMDAELAAGSRNNKANPEPTRKPTLSTPKA